MLNTLNQKLVPEITVMQHKKAKNSANDAEDLPKRLFILVIKKELELKPSSVCCTKVHSIKIISWEYNVCLTISITSSLAYCRKFCLDIQFSQSCNIK